MQEIFRAYDIRGIVDKTLTEDIVYKIGKAVATKIKSSDKTIVVARDGRLSGNRLLEKLKQGLIACGCKCIDIGSVPTPVLYFAREHLNIPSAIMLTGSHNPSDYNGLKIILDNKSLYGPDIQDLYNIIFDNKFNSEIKKTSQDKLCVAKNYIDRVCSDIKISRPLKIVVDAGNGVAGPIAVDLYKSLSCEVIPLYCDIDGNFPNHHPDPGDPKNLQELIKSVKENNADLGLAFDGDGDRLGVVDNNGKIIWPDRLLMLFAEDVLSRCKNATIIYDVKCTRDLKNNIESHGGVPLMWKTGHSLIKAKMKETDAYLAGEMSGHVFFKERWYGFDDALYSGARLIEILSQINLSSSDIFAKLPENVSTPEINIDVTEESKFLIIQKLIETADFEDYENISTIDGIRVDFKNGWGLVRASNTTPKLVTRFEAKTSDCLDKIRNIFEKNISKVIENI